MLWDKIYQNTSHGLDRRKWSQIYRSLFCRTHLYAIPLRFAHRTLPTACWSTPSSISKDEEGLTDAEKTIVDCLKEGDYKSACLGKWHLGCCPQHYATRHGFDYYFGLLYSNDMNPLHLYENKEAIETEVDQAQLTRRYTD